MLVSRLRRVKAVPLKPRSVGPPKGSVDMSLDVCLQAFENEEPQAIPTTAILECLAPFIEQKGEDFVDVSFGPQDSCTFYFATTDETVQVLTVNRPCGDARLAQVLFQIMELGNFILFVPGEERPIVLKAQTNSHVPPDMLEALGEPVVADDVPTFTAFFMGTA